MKRAGTTIFRLSTMPAVYRPLPASLRFLRDQSNVGLEEGGCYYAPALLSLNRYWPVESST
jgi:hypothetical protein